MNALTVNGKQLTLNNMNIHLNYAGEEATFDSRSTLYAGVYEFRVNIPDAVVVRCRNLPEIGEDTVLPIVNGVAKLVLTSDVNIWNASIWPMWPQPEEYKDDPHYVMPVYLNSSNFELFRINFGEILGYEEGHTLLYLTYFTDAENNVDVPVVNTLGSTWNLSTAVQSRNNAISVNGAMPASYSAKTYANLGNALTDILPVTNLRKFTVGFWAKSNTSGAVQFLMTRYHTAFSNMWIYALDATSLLNFNFNLSASNCEVYNGATSSQTGEANPNIGSKTTWNYWSMYVDRDDNYIEFYVNGTLVYKIFNKENLVGGTQDIDTIMRFYPDASYYQGYHITELAIWNGKYTDMPTAPLR